MFTIRKHIHHGKKTTMDHLEARKIESWESSNGRKQFIMDMDKNHINNCINKIKRGEFGDDKTRLLSVLEAEQIHRVNLESE